VCVWGGGLLLTDRRSATINLFRRAPRASVATAARRPNEGLTPGAAAQHVHLCQRAGGRGGILLQTHAACFHSVHNLQHTLDFYGMHYVISRTLNGFGYFCLCTQRKAVMYCGDCEPVTFDLLPINDWLHSSLHPLVAPYESTQDVLFLRCSIWTKA